MDIGAFQRKRATETRRRVEDYFRDNPHAKQHECAADLGLHLITVSKHASAIRAEWLAGRKVKEHG